MSERLEEKMAERMHHSHSGWLSHEFTSHKYLGSVAQNKVKVNDGWLAFLNLFNYLFFCHLDEKR